MTPNSKQPPPSTPQPLDYSDRSRLGWIGRHRKKLIFLAICIALAIPIYQCRNSLKHRVIWLYWSHRAATFKMPGPIELVVDDPAEVTRLLATNPNYVRSRLWPSRLVYSPLVYRGLAKFDPRCELNPIATDDIVFLGKLKRPDGIERIVILKGAMLGLTDIYAIVLPLPGLMERLPMATTHQLSMGIWHVEDGPAPFELRGATVDPNDPSHLVIRCVVGGRSSEAPHHVTINEIVGEGAGDAFLQNDDSLQLKIAPLPGTRWSGTNRRLEGNVQKLQQQAAGFESLLAAPKTSR